MICLKCGKMMFEGAKFCTCCGTIAGSKVQKVSSQLYRPERVIKQGPCDRVKNTTKVINGKVVLTNHQFVYLRSGLYRTLTKIFLRNIIIGDIYIPLSQILSIREGHKVKNKTITINTKSGEKYYFSFKDHYGWINAIEDAVRAIK
ncbi:MAG: hypothetical protein AB9844_10200 [Clostridiaceae bacterium]